MMTLGQEIPLEHKFSAEAHYENLLPIQSPQCPQTQVGQRNSKVLTLAPSVPFLSYLTLPRRSALLVSQRVFWNCYPSTKKRKFWLKQSYTGFLLQDFSDFLLWSWSFSGWDMQSFPNYVATEALHLRGYPESSIHTEKFWKMQAESILLHLRKRPS